VTAPAAAVSTPGAAPRPWLVVCALLAGGSVLGWWAPAALLDWQPELALGEPWRLVTAAWVHWSPRHLAANLVGIAVVAMLGVAAKLPPRAALAWAIAWPMTHAGLAWQPALAHYGGASGVLHAAVAVAACWLMLRSEGGQSGRARAIGAAIAAGLVVKILLERPWAGPLAPSSAWDIAVAPLAHASGALAGATTALVAWALRPKGDGVG
jgi:rhomboid family GlyGly-CTERM serine protease